MSLAVNISDACRRHITSAYAAALDFDVKDNGTPSGRHRPCRLDDYRARVAAYSAAYWTHVDEAVLPALIAHRRYVDRVGSVEPSLDKDAASSGARRAAAWLDFPRELFNTSRRRLPWTRRQRVRRQTLGRSSTVSDDNDEALVDFWMFLDVPDVDDTMMWTTRLRQRYCTDYRVVRIKLYHTTLALYIFPIGLRYDTIQ